MSQLTSFTSLVHIYAPWSWTRIAQMDALERQQQESLSSRELEHIASQSMLDAIIWHSFNRRNSTKSSHRTSKELQADLEQCEVVFSSIVIPGRGLHGQM